MSSAFFDDFFRKTIQGTLDVTGITTKAILTDVQTLGLAVTAATNASPIQVTVGAAHGLTTGDKVTIAGALGNLATNGVFRVTVVDTTNVTLDGSTGSGAYTSGGVVLDLTNYKVLSDIPGPARVSEATVTNVTVAATQRVIVDADDIIFVSVSGATCEAVIFYEDTGAEGTSSLLWVFFGAGVTGLPVSPSGSNIRIDVDPTGLVLMPDSSL